MIEFIPQKPASWLISDLTHNINRLKEKELFSKLKELVKIKIPKEYRKSSSSYNSYRHLFDRGLKGFSHNKFGKSCKVCNSKKNLHRHHIIPLCNGGINMLKNIILLCRTCHYAVHNNLTLNFTKGIKRTILRKYCDLDRPTAKKRGQWVPTEKVPKDSNSVISGILELKTSSGRDDARPKADPAAENGFIDNKGSYKNVILAHNANPYL